MTAVLKDSFSNPFSDFPIERSKGISPDISALKSFSDFAFDIANPKSGFKKLNPVFPIELTLDHKLYASDYDSDSDSLTGENQP